MSNQPNPRFHNAFTSKFPNAQREITTKCSVFNSFDSSIPGCEVISIWDTGATSTAISSKLAKTLKLIPIGQEEVRGVNSRNMANRYIVNIILPNNADFKEVSVLEVNIGDKNDVLIGMDIIASGDFSVCAGKVFSFAVPSFERPIDFVEKANKVNERIFKRNRMSSLKK